jgi:hypothetical protein
VREFADAWVEILRCLADQGFALPPLDPVSYNCPFDLESTVMIGCDGSLCRCSSSSRRLAVLADDGGETGRTALHERVKARDPMADPACRDCRDLPLRMGVAPTWMTSARRSVPPSTTSCPNSWR